MLPGALAKFWGESGQHFDAEVHLVFKPASEGDAAAPAVALWSGGDVVARIPVHRVVLAAASEVFAASLGPAWTPSRHRQPAAIIRLPVSSAACVSGLYALLRCIYTGTIDLRGVEAVLTDAPSGGPAAARVVLQVRQMCACMHGGGAAGWQMLAMQVIQLADQFAVPSVLDAAIARLERLFSFQLDLPAVELCLHLPASLAQQSNLSQLRQMAQQSLLHHFRPLERCLASLEGRRALQRLPPDAIASLLAADAVAVASENSILITLDLYLAGALAAGLVSQLSPDKLQHLPGAAAAYVGAGSQPGSVQQLLAAVRLPLCTGGMLAAILLRWPWLCRAVTHSAAPDGPLSLLRRYYR